MKAIKVQGYIIPLDNIEYVSDPAESGEAWRAVYHEEAGCTFYLTATAKIVLKNYSPAPIEPIYIYGNEGTQFLEEYQKEIDLQ